MAEKIQINLSNDQKKVPMSNFCRHLEIGKSVRLYKMQVRHKFVLVSIDMFHHGSRTEASGLKIKQFK
jgi:hypothetical protein